MRVDEVTASGLKEELAGLVDLERQFIANPDVKMRAYGEASATVPADR